jgi:hypothetical protein
MPLAPALVGVQSDGRILVLILHIGRKPTAEVRALPFTRGTLWNCRGDVAGKAKHALSGTVRQRFWQTYRGLPLPLGRTHVLIGGITVIHRESAAYC